MDYGNGVAPAVASILDAARNRKVPDTKPISVNSRSLERAIESAEADDRVPVIAEIKPTSPTTEGIRNDDPVELAMAMVSGGACALSVLTEPDHFGGSPERLTQVRNAVSVPVLRKDFILSEEQLDVVSADIILLIARFVDDLASLYRAARERGFQVLVEVHTVSELREALAAGASVIGINNRDLAKLDVDLSTFERVAPEVPDTVTLIAESGIHGSADVRRMRTAGADALLIGSAIMAGDVRSRTAALTGAEQ